MPWRGTDSSTLKSNSHDWVLYHKAIIAYQITQTPNHCDRKSVCYHQNNFLNMEIRMHMEHKNTKCKKSIWGNIWFIGCYWIVTIEDWEGGRGRGRGEGG